MTKEIQKGHAFMCECVVYKSNYELCYWEKCDSGDYVQAWVFAKSIAYLVMCIYEHFDPHVCILCDAIQQGPLHYCSNTSFPWVTHPQFSLCAQSHQKMARIWELFECVPSIAMKMYQTWLLYVEIDPIGCVSKYHLVTWMTCVRKLYIAY